MIKHKLIFFAILFFLSALLITCKRVNEKTTDSGMKYIVYTENTGPKAKQGDYVTIEMVYMTEDDSVFFDSRKNKMPMRFQLEKPPFSGSMQEGLTYLAEGDSATFFVSADSLVKNLFSKMGGPGYVRPAYIKEGSFLKFNIKLLRIQNMMDAAEEIYKELDQRAAMEKSAIEKYVSDHNLHGQADSAGIYVLKNSAGKGTIIENGKTISIYYTGKFLTGEVFYSNAKTNKPYSFTVGKREVIRGWDIAFQKFRQGDKATLIIPSKLAYGEDGVRNKMNGTYFIQPNTPLLYEVEVVEVK